MSNIFYTLITGASEGFGKALATACARRKMNLILVALPGSELQNIANSLRFNYSIDVVNIEMDLCKDENCFDLFNKVNDLGLQVNMIFNNAGIGGTGLFGDGNIKLFERQIKLNVLATTLITRLFLDMLKHNSPSYILNVGSLASFFHLPKKQVYGATKSFIYHFSKSLRKELKKDKVYVSVLCPGSMNTNMEVRQVIKSGNYFTRISSMNPEEVVPAAIDGLLRKKEVIIPGRLNKFFLFLDTILPQFIKIPIIDKTMKRLNPGSGSSISFKKDWQPRYFTRA
jgi:uncharacterized protein